MADRTVKVTLVAQASGYIAGMDQAARKTRELGSEAEKLAQKRAAFEGLGRGMLALGLAAAVGVGFAVSKFAEFDQAMSQVQAVTQETADGQKALWDAALEAGGRFPQTAREAANAEEELAKAGITTANILSGALSSSLELANAGQLEVARSAEIVGITLKQFNLDGTQAARVADVLTASANKAVGGVEELAQGLKFVGPVSDSMNVSLEDTVATLTLFADRGVLGEQAGTSLRGVLSSLTSPSKAAQKELARLNVELYDGQGRFLGLENTAGQLNKALAGVSDSQRDVSLGIIFGNQQVTAARILVDAGATTWREYRAAVDDSGIAARIAAERMDNLAGDVEKLGGALDTALIQTGSGANDVLREVVQTATFLVDNLGEVPAPVLGVGLAFLAAAAGVTTFSGASLLLIPRLADLRVWMSTAGVSAGGLALRLGGATVALTVITSAIAAYAASEADVAAATKTLQTLLDQTTGALNDQSRQFIINELSTKGAFDAAEQFGISQKELVDTIIEGGPALDELKLKVEGYAGTGAAGRDASLKLGAAIRQVRQEIENSKGGWEDQQAASRDAAAAADDNAEALAGLAGQAQAAGDQVDELADKIRDFGTAQFDLREANRQVEESLDNLQQKLAENGHTFDITTDAGRENQAALDDLAKSYLDQAAAAANQQGTMEAALPILEAGREAFIKQATAALGSKDAAEKLADQLGLIPQNVSTLITVNTSAAQNDLDRFIRLNNGRSVRINAQVVNGPGFAYGGPTPPGPKFQVAGWVHAGEFVSTQETLAKPANRAALEYMHAGGDISRWQKASQYMVAPSAAVAPQFEVVVSPRGGINLLDYVDIRIEAKDRSDQLTTRMGRKR